MIFDRWGMLIFYTDDINKGWDGRANGGSEMAQVDAYVYLIKYKSEQEKHNYDIRGVVNIINF